MPQQVRQEFVRGFFELELDPEPVQVGHLEFGVAAWIDSGERLEVGIDIERHTVETCAAPNSQADTRELVATDVNAGRISARGCFHPVLGREVHNTLFQRCYKLANAYICPSYVDQRVDHQNAGAMKRNLAATIDLHYRDVSGCEQVFLCRIQAQRENRWVFAEPDFVRRRFVPLIRELLHCPPQWNVVLTTKKACLHSAKRTSS